MRSTYALRQALADVRLRLEADSDVTTIRYVSPVGAISPRRASSPATPSLRPTTDRGGRSLAASSTPSPDSGLTDRENAARLRVAQVQAHLRESRRHLDAGELQLALAAVAQALKLDDAHPEARALLAEVDASREHAVTEWIAEARERVERGEATLVAELLDRINALDPGHPDVPTLTRDLRLVRVDPATKTIEARNRVPNRPVVAGNWASLSRQHRAAITGAATVIVVAAVIGTGLYLGTPPTSSLVVLDATPWATITQIQNGDGEPQPLPEMRSTPLAVQLTPGAYTVSFEGPPPQSEKRTIEIRVESGAAHTAPVQRLQPQASTSTSAHI